MGMIRVSDEVETRLREVADGRSMNAVIEKMLAYCSTPDGFCPVPEEGAQDYEPYILEHLDKRFDELKALIEDTTVDRIDSRPHRSYSSSRTNRIVPWECIQDVYFDFPEGEVWLAGARENWGNSDCIDMATFYVNGDEIWSDFYGTKTPMLKITPELAEYLHKKGFDI